MKNFMSIVLLVVFFAGCSHAKKREKYYQKEFCNAQNGVMEYRLKDKTRVDCLTDEFAVEVDWAKKWAEAVGQSLYYAYMSHKRPAIVLIVRKKKDKKYIKRAKKLTVRYNIKLFIIDR